MYSLEPQRVHIKSKEVGQFIFSIFSAYLTDGRNLSIWDTFSNTPNKTRNSDNGNIACDHYNRFREDVKILSDMGVHLYRFSISWSRLLPNGRGPINPKGVEFYNNLINELLKYKIVPFVTLFHWDLPQTLQDEYAGFLDPQVVEDFVRYAEICFDLFGDRVKHWLTFNEPYITSAYGFYEGINPPQRCSDRKLCSEGDEAYEIYLASHHQILAHGRTYRLYREKFFKIQRGVVGISLNSDFAVPFSSAPEDVLSAQRYHEFQLGWFADPIWFGDYPASMKQRCGDRLPKFTESEMRMLKNSSDFFGLNHYTSRYSKAVDVNIKPGYFQDRGVILSLTNSNGQLIGPAQYPNWLYAYPQGLRGLLTWIDKRYNHTIMYVTENGVGEKNLGHVKLDDSHRIDYYDSYLEEMWKAIYRDGVDVRGYMAWSLMDNFEWGDGYDVRFGMVGVDYSTQTRTFKNSAIWWRDFMYEQNFRKSITTMKIVIGILVAVSVFVGMSLFFVCFLCVRCYHKYLGWSKYEALQDE